MQIETLLPLGKLDPGLKAPEVPLDISSVGHQAKLVERLGYDRVVVEETKDDPFIVMSLAAASTTRIGIGTSVAIAFARSPAVTAMSAWTLQRLSEGRFVLGLGTQVKGHVERRFGIPWSAPAPWMREYIGAVRAIWDYWQNGTELDFRGNRYNLNLMVPLFTPGAIEHPDIPIHIAAVGSAMSRLAGEAADGIRPHPVCTRRYMQEIMQPAVATGAAATGRNPSISWAMKPLVATASDGARLDARIATVRERVAFYLSTPSYRPVFDLHGWGDLARALTPLSKQRRWDEMAGAVTPEIFDTIAVAGTHDEIAGRLRDRFGGIATNIEFSIPVESGEDEEQLASLVADLRHN